MNVFEDGRKWPSGLGRFVLVAAATVCLLLSPALGQGDKTPHRSSGSTIVDTDDPLPPTEPAVRVPVVEQSPRVVVYRLKTTDPQTRLSVLQRILKRRPLGPGSRMEIDPKDGSLIVVARPCDHAAIKEDLAKLERGLLLSDVEPTIRLYDGFDGKFTLNWEPVRPDPTHVSLTKNPGKLTITTQRGGVYGSVGPSAKNFYLIRSPVAEGGDFVLTTCIESFKPTTNWQQAGLLVYDDDDNYLKCDIEWNGSAVQLKFIRETNGEPINETDRSGVEQERIWIRLIKRGKTYERAYSTDGKEFVSAGDRDWGDGTPKWIGIFAKNGPTSAPDIDAAFDFFEARSLTDAEKNNPVYVERQKLEGTWKVVSCKLNGKSLEDNSFSQFVFDGASVTVKEKTQSITTGFTLDVTKEPKRLALSALSRQAKRPTNGVYSLEGETLVICLALQPNAPAPTELQTKEGDSRLLITLRRTSEEGAADAQPVR